MKSVIAKFADLSAEDQQLLYDSSVVASDRLLQTETFKDVTAQITKEQSLTEERILVRNNENSTVVYVNVSSMRKRPSGASEYDQYLLIKAWCETKMNSVPVYVPGSPSVEEPV